jgi:hypothetical protein
LKRLSPTFVWPGSTLSAFTDLLATPPFGIAGACC